MKLFHNRITINLDYRLEIILINNNIYLYLIIIKNNINK